MGRTVGGGDLVLLPVDPRHARTGTHAYPLVREDPGVEGEVLDGLAGEVPRETDTIVRPVLLVAEHGDRPAVVGVTGGDALDEAVRHHSRTDHDQATGRRVRSEHASTVGRRGFAEVVARVTSRELLSHDEAVAV